jgi:predicted kinase
MLLIMRGIPGSGKSHWVKNEWLNKGPNRVRVNRDDLRMQLFNKPFGVDEESVTVAEQALVTALLASGQNVVVDDTNIRHSYIRAFVRIAINLNVPVAIKTIDVGLDKALEQNRARGAAGGNLVPDDAIIRMHKSMKASGNFDLESEYMAFDPYIRLNDKPELYLFDIDGTLASMKDRSPFEWMKVGNDDPRMQVIRTAQLHYKAGAKIGIMSGRDGICEQETRYWLMRYNVNFHEFHMRKPGDSRKDSIVKMELFNEFIRFNYNVLGVYDDRQQVVDMWRLLGLDCFQVQPGNF